MHIVELSGDREISGSILVGDIAERRATQASPRSQQGHGLQNIGLARSIGAAENHESRHRVQAQLRIVAKIVQSELGQGHLGAGH